MNSLSDGSFYLTYQDVDKLKDKITKLVSMKLNSALNLPRIHGKIGHYQAD